MQLIIIPSANDDFIPTGIPVNSSNLCFRYETGESRVIQRLRSFPAMFLMKSITSALFKSCMMLLLEIKWELRLSSSWISRPRYSSFWSPESRPNNELKGHKGAHTDRNSVRLLDYPLQIVGWVARDNIKLGAHTPTVLNEDRNHCWKRGSGSGRRTARMRRVEITSTHVLLF